MTSGIEPATYRFVVLCLNHYATAYPHIADVQVEVQAVCGSYSTAALRHIVLLPE